MLYEKIEAMMTTTAESRVMRKVRELLGLLSMGMVSKKKSFIEESQLVDEGKDVEHPMTPAELGEMRKKITKGKDKWNEGFLEILEGPPAYMTPQGLKEFKAKEDDMFFSYVLGTLQHTIGEQQALMFAEDAMAYLSDKPRTFHHFAQLVHSQGDISKRQPVGKIEHIKKSDPNYEKLVDVGNHVVFEVLREKRLYVYDIKFVGTGVNSDMRYEFDASKSHLDFDEDTHEQHKAVISSVHEATQQSGRAERRIDLITLEVQDVEHYRGHVLLAGADEVKEVLRKAIVNGWMKDEYPSLVGDLAKMEKGINRLKKFIDVTKREIEEETDEGKVSELKEKLKKAEGDLEEMMKNQDLEFESQQGKGTVVDLKRDKPHTFDTSLMKKYVKQDSYKNWFNVRFRPGLEGHRHTPYVAPGVSEQEEGYQESDFDKLRMDLVTALKGKGKFHPQKDGSGGIPYSEIIPMMWRHIQKSKNPDGEAKAKSGWTTDFVEDLAKYSQERKVPGFADIADVRKRKNELLGEIQETIMEDERFQHLKNNLVRFLRDTTLKTAEVHGLEGLADLKDKDQLEVEVRALWKSPTPESIGKGYASILLSPILKDMNAKEFNDLVLEPTTDGFVDLLESDTGRGLEVLKSLSLAFGGSRTAGTVEEIQESVNQIEQQVKDLQDKAIKKDFTEHGQTVKELKGQMDEAIKKHGPDSEEVKKLEKEIEKTKTDEDRIWREEDMLKELKQELKYLKGRKYQVMNREQLNKEIHDVNMSILDLDAVKRRDKELSPTEKAEYDRLMSLRELLRKYRGQLREAPEPRPMTDEDRKRPDRGKLPGTDIPSPAAPKTNVVPPVAKNKFREFLNILKGLFLHQLWIIKTRKVDPEDKEKWVPDEKVLQHKLDLFLAYKDFFSESGESPANKQKRDRIIKDLADPKVIIKLKKRDQEKDKSKMKQKKVEVPETQKIFQKDPLVKQLAELLDLAA